MQDVASEEKERVKALGKSVKFNPLCMQAVCKHKYMRNIQMNHTLTLLVCRATDSLGGSISYHPKILTARERQTGKSAKVL